jgi:hypothetical protein
MGLVDGLLGWKADGADGRLKLLNFREITYDCPIAAALVAAV